MAITPSNMLPLGTIAPDFSLTDTRTGKVVSLREFRGEKGTVILFICNHCPYVKHINKGIVQFAVDYLPKGVAVIAISSNDVNSHPEDAPDKMKETADMEGYVFPYLYDETQEVAKAYDAACTPDFYVFNDALKLVYRGQFDDARPGNKLPVTGIDIRTAIDKMMKGEAISALQRPSIGCNIKWKHTMHDL